MSLVFQITSLFTVVATLIALLYAKAWWIRIFDFPRLQVVVLQLISLAGLLIFADLIYWLNMIIAVLVVVSIFIQLSYVFPYFPFAKKELDDGKDDALATVSIMVSNVLMSNRHYEKLIEMVKSYQPDILLAVETDDWWAGKLAPLDDIYPHSVKHPLDNTYGMLLFSKVPLHNVQVVHLIKKDIPSIHAEVTKDGFSFKLACLHPEPPAPDETDSSVPRDKELLVMAKKIKGDPSPYMVLGDLNDVAWSDTSSGFAKISGLRDPRKGRGFFNTYNAKIPLMRFALDHVFLTEEFRVIKMIRLKSIQSDHFPLYIKCGVFK